MSRFVRASKVRHVYCQAPKDEKVYKGFRLSSVAGDHNYIKANSKYMAIPVAQGNGALAVFEMEIEDRRLGPGLFPCLDGHRGPVTDFDFNPFQQQLIATGGDDCVTKVWGIPPEGLKESLSDSLADLVGHDKKVSVVIHHPTAEFVLATGSADKTVKVWDIEAQTAVCSTDHEELLQGLAWSDNGEILASTARDKNLRFIDPRTGAVVNVVEAHDGQRTMKVVFCPGKGPGTNPEAVCTVGFTRQSKRQFRLWDQRALAKPYAQCNIDQAAGAILPFWDEDTSLLYLAGKGDANIRYYELVDGAPWQFYIEEYRTSVPCRGVCTVPKRIVDTTQCEITRMLKLCADKVEPLSFICPRKSDLFQSDLYPDTYAGKASIKASEFFEGKKGQVIKVSMDPARKGTTSVSAKQAETPSHVNLKAALKNDASSSVANTVTANVSKVSPVANKVKPARDLEKELDAANERITQLENLLSENNIAY